MRRGLLIIGAAALLLSGCEADPDESIRSASGSGDTPETVVRGDDKDDVETTTTTRRHN